MTVKQTNKTNQARHLNKRYGTRLEVERDFGIPAKTLSSNYLPDMRRHPIYSAYLLKPSSHSLLISYDGFEDYLKYRNQLTQRH